MWTDVALIMFSCVMVIHMGLVDAILNVFNVNSNKIPIVNCPKCLTFWMSIVYFAVIGYSVIYGVAASFIASYCAIWFDLLLSRMDVLYENIYERVVEENNDTKIHNKTNVERKGENDSMPEV